MREQSVYGRHPVLEAMRSGQPVEKLFLQEGMQESEPVREIRRRAREARVPFTFVAKAVLDRMCGGANHQGVVAAVAARDYADFSAVLESARERGEDPLVLVLDEIQDPRNLGSLVRTADAAGFHGVAVPVRRAAGLTGAVSRTAAGADAWVPVVKIQNVARFLDELLDQGFHTVGADASATLDYRAASWRGPLALVLGGEQKGLGHLVGRHCRQVVRIPMHGSVGSLNVSVAGALLMYEARRAREGG